MSSSINKQLLLTAYAYLFLKGQQGAQQGSNALQLKTNNNPLVQLKENIKKLVKIMAKDGNMNGESFRKKQEELQKLVRQVQAAEFVVPEKGAEEEAQKEKEAAATRIQAGFRGYQGRKKAEEMRAAEQATPQPQQGPKQPDQPGEELAGLEKQYLALTKLGKFPDAYVAIVKPGIPERIEWMKAALLKKCNYCSLDVEESAQACVVCEGEEFTPNLVELQGFKSFVCEERQVASEKDKLAKSMEGKFRTAFNKLCEGCHALADVRAKLRPSEGKRQTAHQQLVQKYLKEYEAQRQFETDEGFEEFVVKHGNNKATPAQLVDLLQEYTSNILQQEHMVWSQVGAAAQAKAEWDAFKAEALKVFKGGQSEALKKFWEDIDSVQNLKEKASEQPATESPPGLQDYLELKDFLKSLGNEAPRAGRWTSIADLVGEYSTCAEHAKQFRAVVGVSDGVTQAFKLKDCTKREQALEKIYKTFELDNKLELRDYYHKVVACARVALIFNESAPEKRDQELDRARLQLETRVLQDVFNAYVAQWKLAPWQRFQRTSQKKIDRAAIRALFKSSAKTISVDAWAKGGFKTTKDLEVNFANFAIWDDKIVGIPGVSVSKEGAPAGIKQQFKKFCDGKDYDGFLHSTGNDTILTIPCRGETQRALQFLSGENQQEAWDLMKAMQAISKKAKEAGSGQAGDYEGMMYTEQRHNFVHLKTVVSEARIPEFFKSLGVKIGQTHHKMDEEGGVERYVMPFTYSKFSQLQ